MRKIFLIMLSLLASPFCFADVKIGVTTDNHYDSVTYPSRLADVVAIASRFETEEADALIFLGDLYDSPDSIAHAGAQITSLEAAVELVFTNPIYMTIGNHDVENIWTADDFSAASGWYGNYFSTTIGDWCIIGIDDTSIMTPHKRSAPSSTITWFENALESARVAGSYILICMHIAVEENYPGDTVAWSTEPANQTALLNNFSGTTGVGITFDFAISAIDAGVIGDEIYIKHGATWGSGTITAVAGSQCTITTTRNLGGTGAADNWTFSWYSNFSGNSSLIRGAIETALGNGADIKAVLSGHRHINYTAT